MKLSFTFHRLGAIGCAAWLSLAGSSTCFAQAGTAPEAVPEVAASEGADASLQAELLKSYLHLQEQLHVAQMAIEQNRKEYQESARTQVAAITEKLNAIQASLETERLRQQEETRRSNRMLLWVAAAFGAAGILAMMLTAMFQWRTMNRMAEVSGLHPQLGGGLSPGLLPGAAGGAPGAAVELSNQRLLSVIDRLERRVFELEHTSITSTSGVAAEAVAAPQVVESGGPAAQITLLLGKGQSLLNADLPEQALACYEEILELDANHPEALVKKGATLERLKQDEAALVCYDRAIQVDRTLTIAYLYKGGVFNRLERYNEALECYEQALRVQAKAAHG